MSICPTDLRHHYRTGRLLPFIGAGVSMSVQWMSADGMKRRGPSWEELVNQAATKLGFADPRLLRVRGGDLQILEYFGIKRNNEFAGLTNWLAREMNPPDEDLRASQIHAKLANLDNCRLFYTTNYDDFLERAMRLHGRECHRVVVEADMNRSISAEAVQVVKFHGDLEYPRHMVISERDYERRLRLDTPMDFHFQADLLGRIVLFLGYSFKDWNVSYLFRLINEKFNQLQGALSGRRAYITVADPSDFEREMFAARNIEVVPVRGSNQTADIAALLEEMKE